MEEHKLTECMEMFFNNLFEIKEFVLSKYEETNNEDFKIIYDKLNKVLKLKQDEECSE